MVLASRSLAISLAGLVLLWVFDLPRRWLGLSFYGEQLLIACLGLALAISFLTGRDNHARPWQWSAAATALAVCGYIALRYEALTAADRLFDVDAMAASLVLIALLMIATARAAGPGFVLVIACMAAFVFIGPHLHGEFQTRPVSPARLVVYLGLDVNSIFGAILNVVVFYVLPFTLFGQAITRTGGGDWFAELASSSLGARRGGAAKVAIVGSGLFGMITGSAVGNVMAVGVATIPMMVRSGFSPRRAAAIEAVGSTGAQLCPPVLGAAAFVMAEFLQVPYGAVVVASILPAILYYAALYFHVDLQAARQGIGGVEAASASARRELWRRGWHFIVPIIFLAFVLIEPAALGLSAGKAALAAAALQLVLAGWRDPQRTAWRTRTIVELFAQAGRSSVEIILIAAAAGMLVGMISISGIAFAITLQLLALAGHSLPLLLMLAAALAWVLGMGMPTVSVYILTATLLAPALVQLGLSPMAAHMFVLYNGMLSMITPPVALAAYAAAQLAGESGWKTGWEACRVGWSTFVLPFLFAAMPGLLFEAPPTTALADLARSLLGIYLGTAAVVGYEAAPLNRARRLAFAAAAIMVAMPMQAFDGAVWLSAVGLLLGALLIYMERRGRGTEGAKPA